MDPVHIFFDELEKDQGNTFTANVLHEIEAENVIFNRGKEDTVTGMVIKPDIADCELVKIENTKKLDRISKNNTRINKK